MTRANHQQKGQIWNRDLGVQGTQKPMAVGVTLKSTCQRWLGYLARTTWVFSGLTITWTWLSGVSWSLSCINRPTVVAARCRPARERIWASPLLTAFVIRWSARDEPEALPDQVTAAERTMGCPSKKKLSRRKKVFWLFAIHRCEGRWCSFTWQNIVTLFNRKRRETGNTKHA